MLTDVFTTDLMLMFDTVALQALHASIRILSVVSSCQTHSESLELASTRYLERFAGEFSGLFQKYLDATSPTSNSCATEPQRVNEDVDEPALKRLGGGGGPWGAYWALQRAC